MGEMWAMEGEREKKDGGLRGRGVVCACVRLQQGNKIKLGITIVCAGV